MTMPDFGIFEPVFATPHGYLALLGLAAGDASHAVDQVRICCHKIPDPFPAICRLLEDSNWRPHLVAAVAMIIAGREEEAVRRLWQRIDTGSWVTPQLGVALFMVDPEFQSRSRTRLEAGCPIDTADLRSMTDAERHSAAGPAGIIHRSAKSAATLLHLLRESSPVPGWVSEVSSTARMKALLEDDIDASDTIAERWLTRIRQLTDSGR